MQIVAEKSPVSVVGPSRIQNFSIKVNAHTMSLMSNLYSKPQWAIVREYGTNMLDAYVKLPKGAPIIPPEIHVPSKFEPWLEFKDYGTGLSRDTIRDVFLFYGATTKDDNNDEVGGFGVGAKAAFCYTGSSSFTVESRYNGEKVVYTAYKDETGLPCLAELGSACTDEPNGVTVKIPVRQEDVREVKEWLEEFLAFFPQEVVVNGECNWSLPKYVYKGKTWGVVAGNESYVVIVGNVPYRLDIYEARKYLALKGASRGVEVHYYIPVGEVSIAPSREDLIYDARTVARLEKACLQVNKELREQLEQDLASATTEWEAMEKAYESKKTLGIIGLTWKGQKLEGELRLLERLKDLVEPMLTEYEAREKGVRMSHPRDFNVSPAYKYWVLVDDVEKNEDAKIRHLLHGECYENSGHKRTQQEYGYALLISPLPGVTADQLSAAIGGFPVTLVSSLPDPVRAPREKGAKRERKPCTVKCMTARTSWDDWELSDGEGGLYVTLERGITSFIAGRAAAECVRLAVSARYITPVTKILGLDKKGQKLLTDASRSWMPLEDFLRDKVAITQGAELANLQVVGQLDADPLLDWLADRLELPLTEEVKTCVTDLTTLLQEKDRLQAVYDLSRILNMDIPKPAGPTVLDTLYSKFPVLRVAACVRPWQLDLDEVANAIFHYLKVA